MKKLKIFFKGLNISTWFIILLFFITSILYIYLKIENDWLEVSSISNKVYILECNENRLEFLRDVKAEKTSLIEVQRRLVNINTNEKFILENKQYTPDIGYDKNVIFFLELPSNLKEGNYIYYPKAVYNINSIKYVDKLLPVVRFYYKGEC